jgi:hypothetical protein
VRDSKKVKANKPKETGSQEKPDYQAPRTYEKRPIVKSYFEKDQT